MSKVLEHRFAPRGAAVTVLESRSPEILLSGPAGTGKSRACLEKLHLLALINPGMRGLIVRKTRSSLGSTALVTWREHVVPEAIEAGTLHYFGGNDNEPAAYRYANGSTIVIGGLDKSTRIMSSEYDVIFVQEAIELSEDDWESLSTRLRNGVVSFQQLIGDTNPDRPTHWLKQRCDRGDTEMVYCSHADNPILIRDDGTPTPAGRSYLDRLGKLSGARHSRLAEGKWVSADGLVYDGFDPAVHLVDPFPIPEDWPRFWSVDFGFTNPFVCQWWAQDPDGRLFMYREWYRSQMRVVDHCARIMGLVTEQVAVLDDDGKPTGEERAVWTEPRPTAVICDHDAEGRATFKKETGLGTTAARKQVVDGVQAVANRLVVQDDGRPRLFIMRGALVEADQLLVDGSKPVCTEDEIAGYVWPKESGVKEAKEAPVKVDDHGVDAMRYAVAHHDLRKGGARVRFLGD